MPEVTECRSCASVDLRPILSFGKSPLADVLLSEAELEEPDLEFPLDLAFCERCALVQLRETVPPEILYRGDYPYYTSVSESLLQHFGEIALRLIQTRRLGPESLVIEAASNDGYMLRNFKEVGIPVLGIDPADGPARVALKAGIDTLCDFFTIDLARQLRDRGQAADVFLANNVLAHVPDLNGFVEGIYILLKDDGVAVIEVPYVVDLVDH